MLLADRGEWRVRLVESAQRIATGCSNDALDASAFNAAADGRTGTRFGMSRLLNEVVVHGFDAAIMPGRPADSDADVATALISNRPAMFAPPTGGDAGARVRRAIRGAGPNPAVAAQRHQGWRECVVRRTAP